MFELIKQAIEYLFKSATPAVTSVDITVPVPKISPQALVRNISIKGLLELGDREGLAQTKYLDSANIQTIAIGITKSDIKNLNDWEWDKQLTILECVEWFKQAVKPYSRAVAQALKVPVTQNQFDALVSITYNIGISAMKKSSFMRRINGKDNIDNIVDAILLWDKPSEIIGRRKKEAALFRNGIYQNKDGCVDRIIVNSKTHKPSYSGRINILEYL